MNKHRAENSQWRIEVANNWDDVDDPLQLTLSTITLLALPQYNNNNSDSKHNMEFTLFFPRIGQRIVFLISEQQLLQQQQQSKRNETIHEII